MNLHVDKSKMGEGVMKKLFIVLALTGIVSVVSTQSFAQLNNLNSSEVLSSVIYGQEDCKAGEKWNEEKQKCEAESG